MSINFLAVADRIGKHLEEVRDPKLTVIQGEPIALPADGSPFACYWYSGDADPVEGDMTLGTRMNAETFTIACFWHLAPELVSLGRQDVEIANAVQSIRTSLWGDRDLHDLATYIDVERVTEPTYGVFPATTNRDGRALIYRMFEMTLSVVDLNGEAIANA